MSKTPRTLLRISGEFLLIVFGVLVALAVDRWAEAQADRELEQMYLERLRDELESLSTDLRIDYYSGIERHARALLPYWPRGEAPTNPAGLAVAAYHAHRMNPPQVRTDTYRELIATGNMRVMRDLSLQSALAHFHGEVEFWRHTFSADWQNRDFNLWVRGRIPPDVQFAIADQCPINTVVPFECTPDLEEWEVAAFVESLLTDQEMEYALNRRLRDVMRVNEVLADLLEEAGQLLRHPGLAR